MGTHQSTNNCQNMINSQSKGIPHACMVGKEMYFSYSNTPQDESMNPSLVVNNSSNFVQYQQQQPVQYPGNPQFARLQHIPVRPGFHSIVHQGVAQHARPVLRNLSPFIGPVIQHARPVPRNPSPFVRPVQQFAVRPTSNAPQLQFQPIHPKPMTVVSVNQLFASPSQKPFTSNSSGGQTTEGNLPGSSRQAIDGLTPENSSHVPIKSCSSKIDVFKKNTLPSTLPSNVSSTSKVDNGTRLSSVHQVQDIALCGFNFLNCPGAKGATIQFETTEKHFYYRNCMNNCADSQFFSLVNSDLPKKDIKCIARPGSLHNHEQLSQEMLELAAIRWECTLRVIHHHTKETNLQSIKAVISLWPHQLSISVPSIELKFSPVLNRYRKGAESGEEFVRDFLNQYGEKEHGLFRQSILKFRNVPADSLGLSSKGIPAKPSTPERKKRRIDEQNLKVDLIDLCGADADSKQDQSMDRPLSAQPHCSPILASGASNVVPIDAKIASDNNNVKFLVADSKEVEFAKQLMKRSKLIGKRNDIEVYAVEHLRESTSSTLGNCSAIFERFVVDATFGACPVEKMNIEHKTILLMGVNASVKSALINAMANYILCVNLEDRFRFHIGGKTECVAAYEFHYTKGFRIPFSLTIVDIPCLGDINGLYKDKELKEMMSSFFNLEHGIQGVDMVGLVAKSQGLEAIMETFESYLLPVWGKDLNGSIGYMVTSSIYNQVHSPPASEASLPGPIDKAGNFLLYNFRNLRSFSYSRNLNPTLREIGWKDFDDFFAHLARMNKKSLSLTKEVLEERKQLETSVSNLRTLISDGLVITKEIEKAEKLIADWQDSTKTNRAVNTVHKVDLSTGLYATNCDKCRVTCAIYRSLNLNSPSCAECPEKCGWNSHSLYSSYRLESIEHAISFDYKEKLTDGKTMQTAQERLEQLRKSLMENRKTLAKEKIIAAVEIRHHNKIALRPFSVKLDTIGATKQPDKRQDIVN